MACHLFKVNPLPRPMINFRSLEIQWSIFVYWKYKQNTTKYTIQTLSFQICNTTCRLQNSSHFVQIPMYQRRILRALRTYPIILSIYHTGPLFTKRRDVLRQDFVNSPRHDIGCYNDRIAPKFDRHLGSDAACQISKVIGKVKTRISRLPRLHEILR